MGYNLILIESSHHPRFPTVVHRMNVITGDYLTPVHLKGRDYYNQIDDIAYLIMRDKPDKIIFDKFGAGYGFYQTFINRIKSEPFCDCFKVDAFGLIIHRGEE